MQKADAKEVLIQNVSVNGRVTNMLLKGRFIHFIHPKASVGYINTATFIDGTDMVAIPGFVNVHTHAAMTLFRGFADDMKLMPWLKKKIWPIEALMTEEDVYWGTRLACLEMIRSGTTTFMDMYQHTEAVVRAVEDAGIRAVVSVPCFDHFKPSEAQQCKQQVMDAFRKSEGYNKRIKFSLGPHSIYTVSGELLQWLHRFAVEHNLIIQMHLAETEMETKTAQKQFDMTPVRYLHSLGVLSPHLLVAHALYVDKDEIRMLADNDVKVAHNPASNMKLGSGYAFHFAEMRQAGVTVGLGTDGCASSNNLDMVEVMKLAALLGKAWRKDPEILSAEEMMTAATEAGGVIAGIKTGMLMEDYLADLCLIDIKRPEFVPNFNFISNLVYAANGSCVDTVICDGKVLMQNRKVIGAAGVMREAERIANKLTQNENIFQDIRDL